jgi:hypothetical protein
VVAEIVSAGARALAAGAAKLSRRIGLPRAPIVLAGGLVADNSVQRALEAALDGALPGWPVEVLRNEPVAGAVALAQGLLRARAPSATRGQT